MQVKKVTVTTSHLEVEGTLHKKLGEVLSIPTNTAPLERALDLLRPFRSIIRYEADHGSGRTCALGQVLEKVYDLDEEDRGSMGVSLITGTKALKAALSEWGWDFEAFAAYHDKVYELGYQAGGSFGVWLKEQLYK